MSTDSTRVLSDDELAILKTVVYASLFDYPLTLEELHYSLLEATLTGDAILAEYESSETLQRVIEFRDGFFFPRGRFGLVEKRQQRQTASNSLLERNRWVLKLVCAIPNTRLVALSGSAAHGNAELDSDIDLFIVTRRGCVWGVAVSVLLLTKILGYRRTVCCNLVLSETRLKIDQEDLFTANQIGHLKPLTGYPTYLRFLSENSFVAKRYPNLLPLPGCLDGYRPVRILRSAKAALEILFALGIRQLLELVSRESYSRYLRTRSGGWSSPDQVVLERDHLKLHTETHRHWVMERFQRELSSALDRVSS